MYFKFECHIVSSLSLNHRFFFSLYTQIAIYPLQTSLIFNNDNRDNVIFYQIKLFQRWLFLAKQFDVSLYKYLSTIIY